MNSSDKKPEQPTRIKNAGSSVLTKYTASVIGTSIGGAISLHSYWHMGSPEMLVIGLILFGIGLFFVYKTTNEANDRYHDFTKALFPQP